MLAQRALSGLLVGHGQMAGTLHFWHEVKAINDEIDIIHHTDGPSITTSMSSRGTQRPKQGWLGGSRIVCQLFVLSFVNADFL